MVKLYTRIESGCDEYREATVAEVIVWIRALPPAEQLRFDPLGLFEARQQADEREEQAEAAAQAALAFGEY